MGKTFASRSTALLIAFCAVLKFFAPSASALVDREGTITLETAQTRFARLAPDALSPSETFSVDDASDIVVLITADLDGLTSSITGPLGEILNADTIESFGGEYTEFACTTDPDGSLVFMPDLPGAYQVYTFPSLGPGSYTISVGSNPAPTTDVAVLIEVHTDSVVGASLLATEAALTQGSTGVLVAALFEGTAPVTGAAVSVWLNPPTGDPSTLILLDDGVDPDTAEGDGLYSGTFVAGLIGEYVALPDMSGLTSSGATFARRASARVEVVAPTATFTSTTFTDQGVDTNGNGLYERLAVTAPVTVVTAGDFILNVLLETPLGKTLVAHGRATLTTGAHTLTAYVEAPAIVATNEYGPLKYLISAAELLYLGSEGAVPADRMENGTQQTNWYDLGRFEHVPIRLTGSNTEERVDTDLDGDFDLLIVHVSIEVAASGGFYYAVELQDACGRRIIWLDGSQGFESGPGQTLDLTFSGSQIGAHGVDGPYSVANLYVYGTYGHLSVASVYQTQAYSAQQFDAYAPFADCNGNAVPDWCDIAALTSVDCDSNGQPDECQIAPGTWTRPVWQPVEVSGPQAREACAMVYDDARGVVVLFGGKASAGVLGDTWEWDGITWTLRATSGPVARWRHALACDAARQRTVLFGGLNAADASLGDTWEWDGQSWLQRQPSSVPWARRGHAMAYDSARQRTVLFGGRNAGGSVLGDTWEWDGSNWIWRNPTESPGLRCFHGMVYDASRARVVLFGGSCGALVPSACADTWEWDGQTWLVREPATSPAARYCHAMAYDATRQRVIVAGGTPWGGAAYAETWEWDGNDWQAGAGEGGPSPRQGHALAFDAARNSVLLFGGSDGAYRADTWQYGDYFRLTQQPVDVSVSGCQGAQLHVQAAAYSSSPTYQWRLNDTLICDDEHRSGTNAPTLTINPAQFTDAGNYTVTVTSTAGWITSTPAVLTVWHLGDMNCDGLVNSQDVDGFNYALFGQAAQYEAYLHSFPVYHPCSMLNADFTCDGLVNSQDIDGFVKALFGG